MLTSLRILKLIPQEAHHLGAAPPRRPGRWSINLRTSASHSNVHHALLHAVLNRATVV